MFGQVFWRDCELGMSFPRVFLDELKSCISLTKLVGKKVIWDDKKSNEKKGDMWASCPLTPEGGVSFHVVGEKGYYYCFDCHAKGDSISFIQHSEGLDFSKAVEFLAKEAGMEIPENVNPKSLGSNNSEQLSAVIRTAQTWFQFQLCADVGLPARDYLGRRDVTDQIVGNWELGYAPDTSGGLYDFLMEKNFDPSVIVKSGLCVSRGVDRFRDKITFPIRDNLGRIVSFGGQSIVPNVKAKYLEGSKSVLFDRCKCLFNLQAASVAVRRGEPLILVEGYLDTIKMVEAGFCGAVSSFGSAVTEEQLRLLWNIMPEPIIAFNGGQKGINAAMRLIERALPLVTLNRSLRFALLPDGYSPGSLISSNDANLMAEILNGSMSLVEFLWFFEVRGRDFDNIKDFVALDRRLRSRIKMLSSSAIRAHYSQKIKFMRKGLVEGGRREDNNLTTVRTFSENCKLDITSRYLSFIVCQCDCGHRSILSFGKNNSLLGRVNESSVHYLIDRLRCSVCCNPPSKIFDDRQNLIFSFKQN